MDAFGRIIDYLRISVADRCNERCLYCRPEGYRRWTPGAEHLNAAEIARVVRAAVGLGFRKFRLTGGEPLLRPDLVEIVRRMAEVPGLRCVGLSTNGTRLAAVAPALRQAGLRTVNISLDALNPERYRRITGGAVDDAVHGIHAAVAAGFECVKLNCVLLRGINEGELWPLVRFAAEHGVPLRLIELMPVNSRDVLTPANFWPAAEAKQRLEQRERLNPVPQPRLGWGPAKYYRLAPSGALVGFIGAMTTAGLCDACNKMRLTADGKIRPCLGDPGELDLRPSLRAADSDERLRALLQTALQRKPAEHQFRDRYQPCRPMTAIGG